MATITPTNNTYTLDISDTSQQAKGVYFLIDYDRTTPSGTETGIEIYQLYNFLSDSNFRYRDYLDGNNVRQKCVEKVTDATKSFFVGAPIMSSCDKIKLEFQFTGYTAGNYGTVTITHKEETNETP